jgi:hypothetical protein
VHRERCLNHWERRVGGPVMRDAYLTLFGGGEAFERLNCSDHQVTEAFEMPALTEFQKFH